jgi:hypothetical protein
MAWAAAPPAEYCLKDHGFSAAIVERAKHGGNRVQAMKCPGSCQSSERQQAVRAAESKCLQRTPKGVRAARKGTGGLLPGAESRSSEVRVFDGTLKPTPEDSLHYCLLLGGGDTNDRGEDDEGFNTPVCRPRGVREDVDARAIVWLG